MNIDLSAVEQTTNIIVFDVRFRVNVTLSLFYLSLLLLLLLLPRAALPRSAMLFILSAPFHLYLDSLATQLVLLTLYTVVPKTTPFTSSITPLNPDQFG